MKTPDFDKNQLRKLMAEALDGQIDEAGRITLNETLTASPEARRYYRGLMHLHAQLHLEYDGGREAESMPGTPRGQRTRPRPARFGIWIAAAACAALLAVIFLRPGGDDPQPFATLDSARSATWGGGDLPTDEGARLGKGKLSLREGLAVIRFDSGAKLSLEAPAEIVLIDSMNCRIVHGTAVANVPDSAVGFRVGTPSAMVVDHGTSFSVNVNPETGGTVTQVFEGLVDVENPSTGEVVSLKTGQRNTVEGTSTGPATEGFQERFGPAIPEPFPNSTEWHLLEASKDAYMGYSLITDSDWLLYVKHGKENFHRKAYMAFDLASLDPAQLLSAELILQFEPTGLGLASHVPDATFAVYGLEKGGADWSERPLNPRNAPANIRGSGAGLVADQARKLGTFTVPQGVQRGRFGINGEALAHYLRENTGTAVTLVVVRETAETMGMGLVHGIASRRHPILPGPTLAIRKAAP